MGRNTKRKYPRTETLKVRISNPHLVLLRKMQEQYESDIVSQADVVEWALDQLGAHTHTLWAQPEDVKE